MIGEPQVMLRHGNETINRHSRVLNTPPKFFLQIFQRTRDFTPKEYREQ
jgi:hypothetical protein